MPTLRDVWLPALEGFGIHAPPYWIQTASAEAPDTARSSAHLLMAAPSGQRPDGLIVMDDNLVPQATAGLLDAGVLVPRDVVVVAHANFPHPTASAVPAYRLGYDVNAILDACVASLQAQRRGEATPDVVTVPTTWEESSSKEAPTRAAGVGQAGGVTQ